MALEVPGLLESWAVLIQDYIGLGCKVKFERDMMSLRTFLYCFMPNGQLYKVPIPDDMDPVVIKEMADELMERICDTYEYDKELHSPF